MVSLINILQMALGIAKLFVFAHLILSWLISFQVLNLSQPIVSQIWYGLQRLLEPVYAPIRKRLPAMGGLDLSPLIVIFAILSLEIILGNIEKTLA